MKLPAVPEHIPKCKLTIMNAGYCITRKTFLLKGSGLAKIEIPALFFLIEHPIHGNILFDTGYSIRFYEVTKHFPFSLMRKITPVKVTEQDHAVYQLAKMNIQPDQIILSHLHADHTGGVADFTQATIYVDKKEWEYAQKSKIKLLRKGYLKQLYENISVNQLDFDRDGESYGPFSSVIDFLQDKTIILVPLPGHSIGQIGLLLNISNTERYFLIADSVYVKENYLKNRGGSFLSRFAHFHDQKYKRNFRMLQELTNHNPNLEIIPSHDPTFMYYNKIKHN